MKGLAGALLALALSAGMIGPAQAYERQIAPQWRHCVGVPALRMLPGAEVPPRFKRCYGLVGNVTR